MDYLKDTGRWDGWFIGFVAFALIVLLNWDFVTSARLRIDNLMRSAPVATREAWLCRPAGKGCRDTLRFEGVVGSPEWDGFLKRCDAISEPCHFYVTFLVQKDGIPNWPVRQQVKQEEFEAAVPGTAVRIYVDRLDADGAQMISSYWGWGQSIIILLDVVLILAARQVWSQRVRQHADDISADED